jgi:TAT (twin-arginine translocation) pathway signal sequence
LEALMPPVSRRQFLVVAAATATLAGPLPPSAAQVTASA